MNPRQWGKGDTRRLSTRDFPPGVLALVDARQGGRFCEACRELGIETPETVPLQIDHKQALSCGGDNHHLNLRWLCRSHNTGRGARPVREKLGSPRWARRKRPTP